MNKIKKLTWQVPSWLVTIFIFGILYLTGLHTEVIGQVQRIILATGLIRPDIELTGMATVTPATLPEADYNLNLRTLSGEAFSMNSLRGKVVFINFWATWCPPCIAEMPNIQSLFEKVKSDKIAFVMVSLDQNPAKAQKFILKKGFTFPVYTLNGPLPAVYEGQVIPTTFVISPEGLIIARKEGMADYDNQEFQEFLIYMNMPDNNTSSSKQ